jgi:hypothetical protein
MRVLIVFGGCALGVALGPGCKSLEQGAREEHARAFSCPENRIDVRPRKGLDAYALTFGEGSPPPDDVKRDPERYALWKKQQRESHDRWNSMGEVMEANGCGHDVVYFCTHPNGNRGGQNLAVASCSPLNHQPGKK